MNAAQRKSKLRWRCRRGMLELDVILERFVAGYLDTLPILMLDTFEALIENPDPDLYAWLMGYESPTNREFADCVAFIRATAESRTFG